MPYVSTLTKPQERLLAYWRLFAKVAFGVSLAALIPPIGALLVPHTGWPLFGFIFYGTLVPLRIFTCESDLGYSSARNFVSIGLAIVAIHGIAQLLIKQASRFDYNPWLTASTIQPLITIALPLTWMAAFWLLSTKSHEAMPVEDQRTMPANYGDAPQSPSPSDFLTSQTRRRGDR